MESSKYVHVNNHKVFKREMYSSSTKQFITGPMIEISKGIGFYQTPIFKNGLNYKQDDIAYLCGKHIAIHNKEIIVKHIQDEEPSYFFYYKNKFCLVLKDKNKQLPPQVKIYKAKNSLSYTYMHTHLGNNKDYVIKSCKFFQRKKLLTVATNKASITLTVWSMRMKDPLCFEEFELASGDCQIMGFTQAEDECYVLIRNSILQFGLGEGITLLGQYATEGVCATLQVPYMGVVTSKRELLFMKNLAVLQRFDITVKGMFNGCCITSNRKQGFFIGYELLNAVDVYKIDTFDEQLYLARRLELPVAHLIRTISLDVNDSQCVATAEWSQEYHQLIEAQYRSKKHYQIEILEQSGQERDVYIEKQARQKSTISLELVQIQLNADSQPQKVLHVHRSAIVSVASSDACGVVLTLSGDRQLKWWNTDALQQSFQLQSTPKYLDIHPNCYLVAVAFTDAVRVFVLMLDELKLYHAIPLKHCNVLKYSPHALALSSHNHLLIYNPYTLHLINQYAFPYPILEIQWVLKGVLLNLGEHILCYSHFTSSILFEITTQSKIQSFYYDQHYDILIFATFKKELYIYYDRFQKLKYQLVFPFNITQIDVKFDALFFATSIGSIRAYLWPFTDLITPTQDYLEIPFHQGPCNKFIITRNGKIYCGGQDGSIYISNIQSYDRGIHKPIQHTPGLLQNLIMNFKPKRQEIQQELKDQEFRLEGMESDIKQQSEEYKKEFKLKKQELDDKALKIIRSEENKKKQSEDIYNLKINELKKNLKLLKKEHQKQKQIIKQHSDEILNNLYEVNVDLSGQLQKMNEEYLEKKEDIQAHQSSEYNLEKLKGINMVEQEMNRYIKEYKKYHSTQELSQDYFSKQKVEREVSYKQIIENLQQLFQNEQERCEELKMKNTKLKKDKEKLSIRKNELLKIIQDIDIAAGEFNQNLHQEQSHQILEQLTIIESSLNEKEMEIKSFRNYNNRLFKYKEVLQYTHDELQNYLEEQHVKDDGYQEQEDRINKRLVLEAQSKVDILEQQKKIKSDIAGMKRKLKQVQCNLWNKKKIKENLENKLLNLIRDNEPKKLKEVISEFYKIYYKKEIDCDDNEFYITKMKEVKYANDLTKMRNFQMKNLEHRVLQNHVDIRQFNQKDKIYSAHYNNLLEECNFLKQENHQVKQDFVQLQNEFNQINEELVANGEQAVIFREKELSPLRCRSTSPPLRRNTQRNYQIMTPFEQLEVQKELKKFYVQQKSYRRSRSPLPTELSNINIKFSDQDVLKNVRIQKGIENHLDSKIKVIKFNGKIRSKSPL